MANRGVVKTELQKTTGSFTAIFAGLSGYPNKVDESTNSPKHDIGGHKWFITIYPGGGRKEDKGYLSCYLSCSSPETVSASYSLCILDRSGHQHEKCISNRVEFKTDGDGWAKLFYGKI